MKPIYVIWCQIEKLNKGFNFKEKQISCNYFPLLHDDIFVTLRQMGIFLDQSSLPSHNSILS